MDSETSTVPAATRSLFLPFLLLAVAVLLSLAWQIAGLQAQRSTFKNTSAQLAEAIKKREPQVAQAVEIKNRLEALAIDLLELSKTNQTADAIVKKYQISQAIPASAKASPAPAPEK